MILIPLVYADHLPEFRWRSVTVGPPPRPIEPPPVNAHPASGSRAPIFDHAPRVFNPLRPNKDTPTYASQPSVLELPGELPIGNVQALTVNPIGDPLGKPVVLAPPRPEAPKPAPPSGPIRVSQGVQMAKLIRQVIPIYPPMAKSAHISGTVRLIGIIAKDGTIRNLQLVSGHPLLTKSAIDAVSQWIYRPTLLSGEPVEVICPIDVNFTLSNN